MEKSDIDLLIQNNNTKKLRKDTLDRLKEVMKSKGWNKAKLAEVTKTDINKINGYFNYQGFDVEFLIALGLYVKNLNWLMTGV